MTNPHDDDAHGSDRGREPDDTEQDLRSTEGSIQVDLARLSAVEQAKAELAPRDPELDRLSDEAVALAERLALETRAERELGRELS